MVRHVHGPGAKWQNVHAFWLHNHPGCQSPGKTNVVTVCRQRLPSPQIPEPNVRYIAEGTAMILAIDPGPEMSAYVHCNPYRPKPEGGWKHLHDAVKGAILPNDELLERLSNGDLRWPELPLVIEWVESFGMPVGKDIFETVAWIGRFEQAFQGETHRVTRREVKLHLCNSARAKDPHVRQALIDKFGPGRKEAIGTKKAPGPLYGIKTHLWSALAVAVTFAETREPIGAKR